ncbi:MAG: indolepyruvate ferredoxin oxidoreductase subunit alpha [Bacillota bacterium]
MTIINKEVCTGCGVCLKYCTVGAVRLEEKVAVVDQTLCTECYVCLRHKVCPKDAYQPIELKSFYQVMQHVLSDPVETFDKTGVTGRGTEESKTNDVTGRVIKGEVGVCIDMGRPGVGVYLRDVEKVAMAVAKAGVALADAEHTPLAQLMTDLTTGKLKDDCLDTRFLSIIIEGKCREDQVKEVLAALKKVETEIDTVFSLGLMVRVDEKGRTNALDCLEELGIAKPVRGKVNVGLGRPLVTA